MKTFYIYLTDLFGGELNYSYKSRLKVEANTERGAVSKVSRDTGLHFRNYMEEIYHSTSNLTGLVVELTSDETWNDGPMECVVQEYSDAPVI